MILNETVKSEKTNIDKIAWIQFLLDSGQDDHQTSADSVEIRNTFFTQDVCFLLKPNHLMEFALYCHYAHGMAASMLQRESMESEVFLE